MRLRELYSDSAELVEALVHADVVSRTGPSTLRVRADVLAAAHPSPLQRSAPALAAAPPRQPSPLASGPKRAAPPPRATLRRQPGRRYWLGAGAGIVLGTLATAQPHSPLGAPQSALTRDGGPSRVYFRLRGSVLGLRENTYDSVNIQLGQPTEVPKDYDGTWSTARTATSRAASARAPRDASLLTVTAGPPHDDTVAHHTNGAARATVRSRAWRWRAMPAGRSSARRFVAADSALAARRRARAAGLRRAERGGQLCE